MPATPAATAPTALSDRAVERAMWLNIASGASAGEWIKDHFPRAWGGVLLPGGAPFSYFQVLILLHVVIAWGIALPLLRSVRTPDAD